MADKLSVADFAASIKAKYPDYANVPDDALVRKIVAKYPDYADRVDVPAFDVKKQNEIMRAHMAQQPAGAGESSPLANFAQSGPMGDVLTGLNKGHEGNYAGAAHGIVTGVGKTVAPAALPLIAAAPVVALSGLAAGAAGTGVARGAAGLVTDNPDYIDVAGDVGGLVGGHYGGPTVTRAAQVATTAAKAVPGMVGAVADVLDPDIVTMTAGARIGAGVRKIQQAREVLAKRSGAAPVAASTDELVADLSSGRPMDGATYVEKLNQLSPEQRAQVIAARQPIVKASPAPESSRALTKRLVAEHQAQYAGPQTPVMSEVQGQPLGPNAAPPPEAAPAPQAAPQAAPPPQAAAMPAPEPTVAPAAAEPATAPVPAKPTPFNPSSAFTAARNVFEAVKETPMKGEVSNAAEFMRRGASPEEAVAKVLAQRATRGVPSAVASDPAAELARRLGTPSPDEMLQAVAARNRTGRWAGR